MQANPYLAQHFGRLSLGSVAAVALSDEESDSMDAAEGFSHFKSPAHMKFSVFKPSKAAPKEAPARAVAEDSDFHSGRVDRPTSPGFEFVPGQRRGVVINNFPSKPSTPRITAHSASTSHGSSALPPLMPTQASLTPRDLHAQRDEKSAIVGTFPEDPEDAVQQALSSLLSPARSPHSPYAPRAPPPATQFVVGSPQSQNAAGQFPSPARAKTVDGVNTTPQHPEAEQQPRDDDEKTHHTTISDLIQRSAAALERARTAMGESASEEAAAAFHAPHVEVSPTTPSLSPPPPFPHTHTGHEFRARHDGPHSHSDPLGPFENADEMDVLSSANVPLVSPTSESHRTASSDSYQAREAHSPCQCLHAPLLASTERVVHRRLSRRPAATVSTASVKAPGSGDLPLKAAPAVSVRTAERDMQAHSSRYAHSQPKHSTAAALRRGAPDPEGSAAHTRLPAAASPSPRNRGVTLDSLNSMIEELGRFLRQDDQPTILYASRDVHAGDDVKPKSASPSRPPPRRAAPGTATRRVLHTAPPPTVLAGRSGPRLTVRATGDGEQLHRGPSSRSRAASLYADPHTEESLDLPSYAQPTKSWKQKNAAAEMPGCTLNQPESGIDEALL